MKNILLAFVLLSSLISHTASSGYFKTMKDAKNSAAGINDILVLHHGAGWNETGKYLKAVWLSPGFKKSVKRIVQLEDLPTSVNELTKEDRQRLEKESERTGKGMDRLIGEFLNRGKSDQFKRIKNYPALSLYDSAGNYVASVEGLSRMSPQKLANHVTQLQKKREKRDLYLSKAEKANGLDKVRYFAQAIRCVTDYVPTDNRRRNRNKYLHYIYKKFDTMARLDNEDKLGYKRALTMEPFDYIYKNKSYFDFETKSVKGKSMLQGCLEKIDKELRDPRNKVLLPIQLQALYIIKYNIVKHLDDKTAKNTCLKGAKIEPDTVLGQGLSGKYLINYGPATIRCGWKERHCKDSKWVIGKNPTLESLNFYIDKPGVYEVSFTPKQGSISVQSINLKAGNASLGSVSAPQSVGRRETATYKLPVKKITRNMSLEIILGNGFSGNGDISIKQYNSRDDISDIEKEFNF